jgi:hypothetical protein
MCKWHATPNKILYPLDILLLFSSYREFPKQAGSPSLTTWQADTMPNLHLLVS